ncbi:MAG: 30S ribosomal protein S16 [Deinococcales bacterium]|jgi:small subunit ribosomal protein S16
MVKIRLTRMGSKRNPHYRMVVVDARKKRSADYIEQIGYYDPRETTENALRVEAERAAYWLEQGAQPTDTVVRLLEKAGVSVPAVHAKKRADYVRRTEAQA